MAWAATWVHALRQRRLELLVAFVSGLALSTALPSINLWPVGFVALAPFLWALRRSMRSGAFLVGFVFGLGYAYASLFWLNSIWPFAPSKLLAFGGVFLLSVAVALYYGVFGWLGAKLWQRRPMWAPWSLAALWAMLEWVRSLGPLAFPWAYLGHTQTSNLPFIQAADLGGAFLISFLLVAFQVLLVQIADPQLRPIRRWLIGVAVLLVALPYAYGAWRMSQSWDEGRAVAVGVSQPNIDQITKYLSYGLGDPAERARLQEGIESIQFDQVRRIHEAAPKTELYVLPETAFTQPDFQKNEALKARIGRLAETVDGTIFFGADNAETDATGLEHPYVAAWMADPERGVIAKAYNKMRLVPFGESLPFFEYIPYFQDKVLGMGTFDRGREYVLFNLNELRFGCGICFESAAPRQMARLTAEGAQFLTVITNDAWYYHQLWTLDRRGAPQHDALSTFRAIENRRWLVRSANTGISRIIDPAGRTTALAPRDTRTFLTGTIHARSEQSVYTRWGEWFVLVFPVLVGAGWWRGRHSASHP